MKNIEIANCRGKKLVIRDIKKALELIAICSFEMNQCRLQIALSKAFNSINTILKKEEAKGN